VRVLVVEDEPILLDAIGKSLREEGYAVDLAADGEEGLYKASAWEYDAVILDLMLPKLDGWEVLRGIRKSKRTPVLILTAKDAVDDRVRGLDGGADDYMLKPFVLGELLARVRALIRRSAGNPSPMIAIGDIAIETASRTVRRAEREVALTAREYAILEILALNRGKIITRTQLYEHICDESDDSLSKVIEVHVSNLRRKLGKDLIETRRGHGYMIRWNFLGWFLLILILVIGGFGGTLYYLVSRSKLDGIDAELEGAARILAERLQRPQKSQPFPPSLQPGPDGPKEVQQTEDAEEAREIDEEIVGPEPPRNAEARGDVPAPGLRPSRPMPDGPAGPSQEPRRERPRRTRFEEIADQADLPQGFLRRFEVGNETSLYFAVWGPDGTLLKESNAPADLVRPAPPPRNDEITLLQRGDLREAVILVRREFVLLVGRFIEKEMAELRRLTGFLLGVGSAVTAIGLIGAWFIVKRTVRPIEEIAATAETISASNLSRRIDVRSKERELSKLAAVLNTTFDRLQEAFDKQSRFIADASHELRTPLSALLAQMEMARRKERTAQEYREAIDASHAATMRMRDIVDGLLTLARSNVGGLPLEVGEVDLHEIVGECLDLVQPLAAERRVTIRHDLGEVVVEGDALRLAQVVTNLTTNAIRYNRPGGEVRVSLGEEGPGAVLTVEDSGMGIPAEAVPRVFDRFFRVDPSRSSLEGGVGLGLAIAKAIVEAHGGTIACASEVDLGSTFTVRLPRRRSIKRPGTGGEIPA